MSDYKKEIMEFRRKFGYENLVGVARKRFEHQEQFLSQALTRVEEAARKEFEYRINGAKFMYEHSWFNVYPEKCCEMCGERIKNNTPCKASTYYKFWLILDSLISPSEEKEESGEKERYYWDICPQCGNGHNVKFNCLPKKGKRGR